MSSAGKNVTTVGLFIHLVIKVCNYPTNHNPRLAIGMEKTLNPLPHRTRGGGGVSDFLKGDLELSVLEITARLLCESDNMSLYSI